MSPPRTSLGAWSVGLAVAFFVLFSGWLLYVMNVRISRPTFFSDLPHAVLILSAAACAITGGFLGVAAVLGKAERSWMIVLSVLLGALVLIWAVAEIIGH